MTVDIRRSDTQTQTTPNNCRLLETNSKH